MTGPTAELAAWCAGAQWRDLPETVRHALRRTFLNFLGCALGGAHEPAIDIADQALAPFSAGGAATLIGRGARRDPPLAALLNAMSASVHVFDDTDPATLLHPGAPISAAALALVETRLVSGADFLLALAVGIEAGCRASAAACVAPARGNLAFIQTGIAGGIGAAVAAGRLLGLDAVAMASAIGIAASQASGLRGLQGSMCIGLMPAQAAQAGLRAAVLAQAGFTGTATALEARYGFLEGFAAPGHPAALTASLGQTHAVLANNFKPYPCGVVINPIIDACLALSAGLAEKTAIVAIRVRASPAALALTDRPQPRNGPEAQVSLQHWAAAALWHGAAGLAQGRAACIDDPAIARLRGQISATADPTLADDAAEITLELHDGRVLRHAVSHARGSAANPLDDAALEAKFHAQAAWLAPGRAAALIAQCWALDRLPAIEALARLAA